MDKRIEEVVNEQLNTEIWSSGLYMAFQVYFQEQEMPILSSWLDMQVHKKGERIRKMSVFLLKAGCGLFVRDMACKPEEWQSPMVALDALFDHEQYFHRQVAAFLNCARGMSDSSLYGLASDLYGDELHVSDFFVELLRMLTNEWRRMLPLE